MGYLVSLSIQVVCDLQGRVSNPPLHRGEIDDSGLGHPKGNFAMDFKHIENRLSLR